MDIWSWSLFILAESQTIRFIEISCLQSSTANFFSKLSQLLLGCNFTLMCAWVFSCHSSRRRYVLLKNIEYLLELSLPLPLHRSRSPDISNKLPSQQCDDSKGLFLCYVMFSIARGFCRFLSRAFSYWCLRVLHADYLLKMHLGLPAMLWIIGADSVGKVDIIIIIVHLWSEI